MCASKFSRPGGPDLPHGFQTGRSGQYDRFGKLTVTFTNSKFLLAGRSYDVFPVSRSGILCEKSSSAKLLSVVGLGSLYDACITRLKLGSGVRGPENQLHV